jgi:hypothetical protein
MPASDMQGSEKRIRALENHVAKLAQRINSLTHKLGQVAEDNSRPQDTGEPTPLFNCITTSAVTARSSTTMGTGTFNFVDATGGTLTTLTAPGSFTGYNDNKAGWASGVYCRVYFKSGIWQFFTADGC